ncbi:MAG TPA: hypothetical protein VMX36_11150 [Sedimentisphaerales bacterium]|nr:hypothetical protein [Sedimentisphaerales bacterium]
MRKIIIIILLAIVSEFSSAEALDVEQNKEPTENGKTYVLIISGISKNSKERLAKDHAVMGLRRFILDNAGVESDWLSVLVDRESSVRKDSIISTAGNLKEQMDRIAAAVNYGDRFIFYYMGQANIVSDTLRLNLPGPDITHKQLAGWINGIKASSMLIVLDCPGAGLAVKAVTGQDRIIIGACTADQHYSTQFSEYFVPALVDERSDTDEDGKISLLEVFTSASRSVDDFYRRQSLLTTETPVLEDNADGVPSRQPWRYEQNKTDGLAASRFFLSGE